MVALRDDWTVSSFCSMSSCVAVATAADGTVLVKDTKLDAGPVLAYSPTEFADFIAGVKAGDFDHMVTPPS